MSSSALAPIWATPINETNSEVSLVYSLFLETCTHHSFKEELMILGPLFWYVSSSNLSNLIVILTISSQSVSVHEVKKLTGVFCAGFLKQSMGARNRAGIGLPYRHAKLHRLAELIPWNWFLGSLTVKKFGFWFNIQIATPMDEGTIKTPNHICRLFFQLTC